MCVLAVSGTRRLTTAEVEQVFKNHGAYGFEAGVWYVLYSPVPLPANKQRRCLDAILAHCGAILIHLAAMSAQVGLSWSSLPSSWRYLGAILAPS